MEPRKLTVRVTYEIDVTANMLSAYPMVWEQIKAGAEPDNIAVHESYADETPAAPIDADAL